MTDPAGLSTTDPQPLETRPPGGTSGPEPMSLRWVALGEVVLCSGIPTQAFLGDVARARRSQALTAVGNSRAAGSLRTAAGDTAVLIGLMVWLMRLHGESPRQLWLGARPVARETLFGLALVPAIFLMVVVLLNALRLVAARLHNVPSNPFEELASGSRVDAASSVWSPSWRAGCGRSSSARFCSAVSNYISAGRQWACVLSLGFGLGHYLQGVGRHRNHRRARAPRGGHVLAQTQQRCAARQPRRVQFDRGAAGRDPWSVGGRTYLMFGTSTSMRARRLSIDRAMRTRRPASAAAARAAGTASSNGTSRRFP